MQVPALPSLPPGPAGLLKTPWMKDSLGQHRDSERAMSPHQPCTTHGKHPARFRAIGSAEKLGQVPGEVPPEAPGPAFPPIPAAGSPRAGPSWAGRATPSEAPSPVHEHPTSRLTLTAGPQGLAASPSSCTGRSAPRSLQDSPTLPPLGPTQGPATCSLLFLHPSGNWRFSLRVSSY